MEVLKVEMKRKKRQEVEVEKEELAVLIQKKLESKELN
jgi:hypothetical protein